MAQDTRTGSAMSEPSHPHDRADRIARTINEHRTQALKRLDAQAHAALGKRFPAASGPETAKFILDLARMVARDLTAIGWPVSDYTRDAVPGGVWLAPSPDALGVIVTWTQHDASVTAFGPRMHCELQRQMNFIVFEVLHTLGYALERYGGGGAHIITRFRAPLDGHDIPLA